jgi:ABC-type transporter Mla maintaining outer membrane lipid asymmetry ATPase subunit MlaF
MNSPSLVPAIQIAQVIRNYGALRPLRIAALAVAPGERVALAGLDAGAAEVLVNLVTGASLPDQGEVRVLGRATSEIASGDEWLASLDRFGIVSPRAVLIEGATLLQNLAIPFTLEIDPVPPAIAERVTALAIECGILNVGDPGRLETRAGDAAGEMRARLHLARAVALDPALVLLEHPTAGVDEKARAALAEDVRRVLDGRRLTALAITQDTTFASRVAHRTLELQPATGELKPKRKGWFR